MINRISTEHTAIYLRVIARWWWLPLLFGVVSGAVGYKGTSYLMKPTYGSSITLQVSNANAGFRGTPNDANSDSVLFTIAQVEQAAYKQFAPTTKKFPDALAGVSCSADANDVFFSCSTVSRNPEAAADVLNKLASAFIIYNRRTQDQVYGSNLKVVMTQEAQTRAQMKPLQDRLGQLEANPAPSLSEQIQMTQLQGQLSQYQSSLSQLTVSETTLRQTMQSQEANVGVVNWAVVNSSPLGPHPLRNALLGLILGIGIAAALIVLLEFLDDTFRSLDEVGEYTGLTMIGAVRRFGRTESRTLLPARSPSSPNAEAYRVVRTNIQYMNLENPLNVLLITSSRDGEGKTTTAANLAATMAIADRRVLLVDCDLRRHGLTSFFELQSEPGVSTALFDPTIDVTRETEVPNLKIAPSGPVPPNPAELLGSDRMREWLHRVSRQFDIIVLDSPPVLSVADTRILIGLSDAVVMIIDPALTGRRLIRQAKKALDSVGARTLGIIVNKAKFRRGEDQYQYYYYYNRYESVPMARTDGNGAVPAEPADVGGSVRAR